MHLISVKNVGAKTKIAIYLDCIEHLRMVNSNWRSGIRCILCARDIENPILPVTRLGFPIPESVHSKPLPSALMPGSFIPMPICKTINSKSMHLISKIFPSICIPIPLPFKCKCVSIQIKNNLKCPEQNK